MTETLSAPVSAAAPVANPFADLGLEYLRRRTSAKWRHYPDDVLPLWVAEMDAAIAPEITAAVVAALEAGDTGYAYGTAYAGAMAGFAADRWGWEIDPLTTARVTDVLTGVLEVLRVTTTEADPIVVTPPVYPPFYMVAKTLGREVVEAPLGEDGRLDPASLEAALRTASADGRQATLILSNPHNPTGIVHTADELTMLGELARRYGVRVISDEIHAPLVMPGVTFTPYLKANPDGPDISVTSSSKGWNLAGFKAAIAIPGSEATDVLAALATRAGGHPGHIGVIAHTAALDHARPWLDAAIAGIDSNRHLLADLLIERLPGATYRPPDGTYLAWVGCAGLGLGDDPAVTCLERGKVAFSSGTPFGPGGEGYLRINIATAPELIAEGVDRIVASLDA